jgi:hypothetical protein
VGLRAGLDTEVRGKILCPCRGSNLDRPVVQFIARHYTGELGSSVNIVSGYRLDDRAIEVRSLAEAKGFFL